MINPRIIRDFNGRISGFVCNRCGRVVQSMWGNTCNSCREEDRKHDELIRALRK